MRARLASGALALAALAGVAWAADGPWAIYTGAQASEGAAIYAEQCASCHGASMGGLDVAPPLAGAAFLSTWSGKPVADLATRIRTTMPMDNPGALGIADTTKLVAALLQANGYPTGETELPSNPSAQRAIILEAQP